MLAYPKGSDLTLMNTLYIRSAKDENTGKYTKPVLQLIYKDNNTGEKKIEEIEDPDYEFYCLNDDVSLDHNVLFIEKDKVHNVVTKYRNLEKTIAEITNNLDFYYDNIRNGNARANSFLHTHNRIFMSDQNIEDHYRFKFDNLYTNNINPVTKSFLDIEVDIINMKGDFPEMGECPINACSVICEQINKTFVFVLRNPNNPLVEEFEKSINNDLFKELKDFIRQQVGGEKNEKKFGLTDMEYEFLFYDEEIQLIQDIFILINKTKPDFILIWNMAFDIPYIIERIKALGYNPTEIICPQEFKNKKAQYFVDERMKDIFAERGDFAYISSYSVFLDQMIQFASRRKGQSAFRSMKLDYIGELTVGVKKLSYKHITTDLAKLPYLDFKTFIFYNIIDTIVQKCIESKVGDIDYIFSKCLINNTRYSKGHRQTVYLTNRGAKEFYNDGFIIGNNNNKNNEKEAFPGGLVGDPTNMSDYAKIKLHGVPIEIFDNLDDFDFKSLYPSIMREFSTAPHTQIGRIIIPQQVHNKEDIFNSDTFDRGGSFLDDLQTHSYLEFGTRWFRLADYLSLIRDIHEYFTTVKNPIRPLRTFNTNGRINAIDFIDKNLKTNAIEIIDKNHLIPVLDFYITPDFTKVKEGLGIKNE